MWANIVLPILVPILTGVTYVGYKHPKSFENISTAVSVAFAAISILALGWWGGYNATENAFLPYVDNISSAQKAIDPFAQRVLWLFLWSAGVNTYFALLSVVLKLVQKEKHVDIG